MRLLVALDALLVEGSVTRAAAQLGIGAPAMSRLLAQLRSHYGDAILTRTGRGMKPTPLAERLRLRLRGLASEAEKLIDPEEARSLPHGGDGCVRPERPARYAPLIAAPALAMRPACSLEGEPSPQALADRLAAIAETDDPRLRLASMVATVGAGAGHSRPLSPEEADEALSIVLAGAADPVQIGALLVAMQYRGPTAEELAGFVSAARRHAQLPRLGSALADLDWPAYISPRVTRPPWFLWAARIVARAGHKVVLHGFANPKSIADEALSRAGIARCGSPEEAARVAATEGIGFLPLSAVDGQIQGLMSLYHQFQMRSPLNLAVQLLNPLGAPASILGASAKTAGTLHRQTAATMGWHRLLLVGTHRDVAQATPYRPMHLTRLTDELTIPASPGPPPTERISSLSALESWHGVWTGTVDDARARGTIVSTAALGLMAVGKEHNSYLGALAQAEQLWSERHS